MARRNTIKSPQVAAVFESYPEGLRAKLLALRQLILDVASRTPGVGELEETLRWGQPSYITAQSRSGSLVRIDRMKPGEGKYAIYFLCQTTLVETFKERYRDVFEFEGNRSITFDENDRLPVEALSDCISMALTYRLSRTPLNSGT